MPFAVLRTAHVGLRPIQICINSLSQASLCILFIHPCAGFSLATPCSFAALRTAHVGLRPIQGYISSLPQASLCILFIHPCAGFSRHAMHIRGPPDRSCRAAPYTSLKKQPDGSKLPSGCFSSLCRFSLATPCSFAVLRTAHVGLRPIQGYISSLPQASLCILLMYPCAWLELFTNLYTSSGLCLRRRRLRGLRGLPILPGTGLCACRRR